MWFWLWLLAAQAEELTLNDALQRALEHNIEAQQARLRLERSGHSLAAAAASYDPRLDVSVDVGATNESTNDVADGVDTLVSSSTGWSASLSQATPIGGDVSLTWSETFTSSNSESVVSQTTASDRARLSVSQPLLDGAGPRSALAGVRQARRETSDEELAWRGAVEQLVLDVSASYWRRVSAERSLELAIRSREIAEQSLQDTQERYGEGFAGSGDVLQVERALGGARQSEVVAEAGLESATESFRRTIGEPLVAEEALVLVDRPAVPQGELEVEEVLARARENNASWRRKQIAAEGAQDQFRVTRNAALPNLAVNGSIGLSGLGNTGNLAREAVIQGDSSDWSVGTSVSVPLLNREPRSSLAKARHTRDLAVLDLEAAEQDLRMQVRNAVRSVRRDRSRLALADDTLRVAKLALDADQELLRDGRGSARNIVLSLESLDRAQADQLQAEIDLQASALEVQRVAGTLLDEMPLRGW